MDIAIASINILCTLVAVLGAFCTEHSAIFIGIAVSLMFITFVVIPGVMRNFDV